jgi:phospholipid transport system substrate-binding protein
MWSSVASGRLAGCIAALAVVLLAGFTAQTLPAAAGGQIAAATAQDPMKATQAMVEGALEILRDSHLNLNQKRDQLRTLAEAHLDFDSMARSTLGHHWSELTPEQRAQFTREFRSFIENAYLGKIQDYSGQKVVFTREKVDGAGQGEVFSQWVGGEDNPVQLNFMLHRESGQWKIYDLVIDGVGFTSNYRNQFSRVLDRQSFDSLIGLLRLKDRQLAAHLAQ